MISFAVLGLIIIAVIVGVVRQSSANGMVEDEARTGRPAVGPDAGRLIMYGVSLVGLMGFLFASSSLVGLGLSQTVFSSHNLMSASDAREQISYFLAGLIVVTPLWLGFWRLLQRRIERSPEERDATERRLFFALTGTVTAVVALFAMHTVLRVLFTLAGPHSTNDALRDGASAAVRLLVYGGAWYFYTHLAWRERSGAERDPARDLGLHVLTAFALVFLSIGLMNLVAVVADQLLNLGHEVLLGSNSRSMANTWGGIFAWIVSGGAVWGVASYVEGSYPRLRSFRVPYLYIVLAVAAGVSIGFGTDLLYELLRRAFGYHPTEMWNVLHDVLPPLVVGGVFWAYYWTVLRYQSVLGHTRTAAETIPWPRRPYVAALSFVGLALAAPGAIRLLWVVIEFIFKRQTLSGVDWWRDHTSAGIALLLVGALLWLRPWSILQAAAAADPKERAAEIRRWLVGGIVLISTLIAVGYAVAFLWLILRMILGGPNDATTVMHIFQYLMTALIAGGLAGYHALILRDDLRAGAGRAARIRVVALVAPGTQAAVGELSRRIGRGIEIIGYLAVAETAQQIDAESLEAQLMALAATGVPRALLILDGKSQTVYPYSRNLPAALQAASGNPDMSAVAPTTP